MEKRELSPYRIDAKACCRRNLLDIDGPVPVTPSGLPTDKVSLEPSEEPGLRGQWVILGFTDWLFGCTLVYAVI